MAKRPRPKLPTVFKFTELSFPARPDELLLKARSLSKVPLGTLRKIGPSKAANSAYISWLKKSSMLRQANLLAKKHSGSGHMWRNPYAKPRPRAAIGKASVWYTAYPMSLITKKDESILALLGSDELWHAFQEIGIEAMHTGPMKQAGGLDGWKPTPSIDGHFDRISTSIDPLFGTEAEFKRMASVAAKHNALIIDDIVPGHTGKGADFRLAEMGFQEYPGIYHMVEIYPEDWNILPAVPPDKDSVNLDPATENELKRRGYIVGKLQRVIFYEPGIKETNWSVTRAVRGTDGVKRRWVYLHYFKEGQPSINWLDPSFAGMKLVIGDALHSLDELGTGALRLDANGFLGIEVASNTEETAWSEEHPLSETANQLIASMVRKLGGFTFQELNLSVDAIKTMSASGADLSYDFINRPAYHHALATGDTEFLRLTLRTTLTMGIDPAILVHAMQNHDEMTYELVHFWTVHKDDIYNYQGNELTGLQLREQIRSDLKSKLTGNGIGYNLPFSDNGIACTTASVIAAVLGYTDISNLTDAQVDKIADVHLLLCMFNALQPGVFAISGWDLCGSLTLDKDEVKELIGDGDTRWINRGAYDLINSNPFARRSRTGMPKARSLYGPLTEQLADTHSFANRLRTVLAVRKASGLAVSRQLEIPGVSPKSVLAMLHELPHEAGMQMTVLNFSNESVTAEINSKYLAARGLVKDMLNNQMLPAIEKDQTYSIQLGPYEGTSLLIVPNASNL